MSLDLALTGPDGLPFEPDEPAVTADRAARLADELAAMADQLLRVLAHQNAALRMARSDVPEQVRTDRLADATRINTRAAATLRLLRDCLGHQHVECDELAHQIRTLPSHEEVSR
jgi:hypothetical protein